MTIISFNGWLSINKMIRANKGFISGIKEFKSSIDIFSPNLKPLWVSIGKAVPNKMAFHVAALDTQMTISFVVITAAKTTAIVLAHL